MWGSNAKGQLGHSQPLIGQVQLKSSMVSCGHEYTVVLTAENELMITGKLPFNLYNMEYLTRFEQLAKFDQSIKVQQIVSSQFTSIVA